MQEGTWRTRLSRRISDWASSSDQHARDLRKTHATPGQVSIADAPDRESVRLSGIVRSVTLRPRGGVPALEAELDDGSGVVTLLWLGRRRIIGVSAGRTLTVSGRIGIQDGHRVIFNPRYELRP